MGATAVPRASTLLGDFAGFAALATMSMALMTVAIRKSRDVEMLPVACLSTAVSALRCLAGI